MEVAQSDPAWPSYSVLLMLHLYATDKTPTFQQTHHCFLLWLFFLHPALCPDPPLEPLKCCCRRSEPARGRQGVRVDRPIIYRSFLGVESGFRCEY